VPVAAAVNVPVWPAMTAWLAGCVEMDGATGATVTVRVAALLVTFPELSVTTTVNNAPLSEDAVGGVVYIEEVAPPMAVPFFFH
jgi:hypothetical protein